VNGTDTVLYIEVPAGITDDLNRIEWIADLQGAASYDAVDGTFTITDGQDVVIPVDAIQVDATDDYDVGDYAEYLGTWRDDWGAHRSGDAYSHDSGLLEIGTIVNDSIANGSGEPGYVIVIGREGIHADRHDVWQAKSYRYIWARDDWGAHVGDTVSNTTGLDAIGYVRIGEDGRSDETILSDSLDDRGATGAIEVVHHEGTGNDTHEIWTRYSSAYNLTRDALFIGRPHKDHIHYEDLDKYVYTPGVIDPDGNVVSAETGELLVYEEVGRGLIRVLYEGTYPHHDHHHDIEFWIYYSAKYNDNQAYEGGTQHKSVYADNWVSFKAASKHSTIGVDLSQLDVKEIGTVEFIEETSHYTHYRKAVGGAEVQVKWNYRDKWEIADLESIDGAQVYEWKYSNNEYQDYKNMAANSYDGGKYRDYLGSYVGDYTTAETVLSGRSIGEIEDITHATVNDGTREFVSYEWNAAGTEYREI